MICLNSGVVSVFLLVKGHEGEPSGDLHVSVSHNSDRKNVSEAIKELVKHFFSNLLFEVSNV